MNRAYLHCHILCVVSPNSRMSRQASPLFNTLQRLRTSPAMPLQFINIAEAARMFPVPQRLPYARKFTSAALQLGSQLTRDPLISQGNRKVRGPKVADFSNSQLDMGRKETFHIHPLGYEKSQEEWFRLSTLDLLITQNYSTHALIFKLKDSDKTHVAEIFKRGLEITLSQCRPYGRYH